jgi:HEAT repeat protein
MKSTIRQFARAWTIGVTGWILLACGCATEPERIDSVTLHQDALSFLKYASSYPDNPVVRAQAIESLHEVAPRQGVPLFREALSDAHDGVRFAACMVLGEMRHEASRKQLARAADAESRSVQAAALFALHRLGDTSRTTKLAELLLHDTDEATRANAALVIGQLGEEGTIKLLDRAAQHDRSPLVRMQALEGMVRLGDESAGDRLTLHAHGGAGQWQVTALLAVARSPLSNRIPLLESRLEHGEHLEIRLAAARGLGWNERDDGYELAVEALNYEPPSVVLGYGGDDERALPALREAMAAANDIRIRLAAARAILEILNHTNPPTLMAVDVPEG